MWWARASKQIYCPNKPHKVAQVVSVHKVLFCYALSLFIVCFFTNKRNIRRRDQRGEKFAPYQILVPKEHNVFVNFEEIYALSVR